MDAAQFQKRMDGLDFDMSTAGGAGERLARQRADRLLELPAAPRSAGHAELRRRLRQGGRCAGGQDRGAPRTATGPGRRGARAGPGAAVELVHRAAMAPAGSVGGLLEPLRPPGRHRCAPGSTSPPGGSTRRSPPRRTPRAAADGPLPAAPPAAGDPDAVRHHHHQLRRRAVRAGRPGGADAGRPARQTADDWAASPAAGPTWRHPTESGAAATAGGAGWTRRPWRRSPTCSASTSRRSPATSR